MHSFMIAPCCMRVSVPGQHLNTLLEESLPIASGKALLFQIKNQLFVLPQSKVMETLNQRTFCIV